MSRNIELYSNCNNTYVARIIKTNILSSCKRIIEKNGNLDK